MVNTCESAFSSSPREQACAARPARPGLRGPAKGADRPSRPHLDQKVLVAGRSQERQLLAIEAPPGLAGRDIAGT